MEKKWANEELYERFLQDTLNRFLRKKTLTRYYKFQDEEKDYVFEKRFNKTRELQDLFNQKHDKTKSFFRMLRQRVRNEDHCILSIYGDTNTGKSILGLTIAEQIIKFFKEIGIISELYITKSQANYEEILPLLARGCHIVLRDENPQLTGDGSRSAYWNMKNFITITRKRQIYFILISTEPVSHNIATYFLESGGLWKEKKMTRMVYYNGDKQHTPLGRIKVRITENKELLDKYDQIKDENIDHIINFAGREKVSISKERIEKDKKLLYELGKSYGARTKMELHSVIVDYNAKNEDNPDKIIKGNPTYFNNIVNMVFMQLKTGRSRSKSGTKLSKTTIIKLSKEIKDLNLKEFKMPSDDEIWRLLVSARGEKWRSPERDINIWEDRKNGMDNNDVAEKYEISQKVASDRFHKYNGYYTEFTGKLFEKNLAKFMEDKKYFDTVKRIGTPKNPDIITTKDGINYIFSLKCMNISEYPKKIDLRDLHPEYQKAYEYNLRGKIVYLFLVLYDKKLDILMIKELDTTNPSSQIFDNEKRRD